jgi:hypothetical protein
MHHFSSGIVAAAADPKDLGLLTAPREDNFPFVRYLLSTVTAIVFPQSHILVGFVCWDREGVGTIWRSTERTDRSVKRLYCRVPKSDQTSLLTRFTTW